MKIICVSHSSRPFVEARASLNSLEQRFSKRSLENLPPLEKISGIESAVPYSGMLTLWAVDDTNSSINFVREYDPGFKVQFATFVGDTLLVYGSDRLQVLDTKFDVINTITDPWLVGGHTLFLDEKGYAWATAAPANALLKVNLEEGKVIERIFAPAIYGKGYELTLENDMRIHYVPTDLQPSHVNCAVPTKLGLLVTFCIPGAVGLFDKDGQYREVARGMRGCHGARYDEERGRIFVTDSPAGIIWFIDPKNGTFTKRYKFETVWLHDADKVEGDVFVASVADHNTLSLFDINNDVIIDEKDCSPFGKSVMFVNVCQPNKVWKSVLVRTKTEPLTQDKADFSFGPEIVPAMYNRRAWETLSGKNVKETVELGSEEECRYEYLSRSRCFTLEEGRYVLKSEIVCKRGGVMVGLLDVESDVWLASQLHDSLVTKSENVLDLKKGQTCRVVITANNPATAQKVQAQVLSLSLRKIL